MILRKFSDKLSLYNVKTGEFKEDVPVKHAYASEDLYDDETEKKLNKMIESQFGNLLSNYLLKSDKEISLRSEQIHIIKKFLLISILRTEGAKKLVQDEKEFRKKINPCKRILEDMFKEYGDDEPLPPFEEKRIEGETEEDYWLRTLNVILDTDGTPEQIEKHSDKTSLAYRWSGIVSSADLAFWDAPNEGDEFVVTDIGMTSERDKGLAKKPPPPKTKFMNNVLEKVLNEKNSSKIKLMKTDYFEHLDFTENFMMFPISSKRMIVLISPFFKFKDKYANYDQPPKLEDLTNIPNPELFKSRKPCCHEEDRYVYDIKVLSKNEIRYCNALFLDRIDTYLGFSSLEHAVGSIIKYKKLNDPLYIPQVDYTSLYKIIQDRYLGSLNV